MKRSLIRCLPVLLIMLLGACDQVVHFQPQEPAQSRTIKILRSNEVDTVIHQFDAQLGDTVVISDSLNDLNTILVLPPELCVYGSGDLCTGEVEVTFVEIYNKEQMVYAGIPTTSQPQLLESGGEFFLSLTQNDNPLFIKDGSSFYIKAPKGRTNSSNPDMAFYVEENPGSTPFNWVYQDELYEVSNEFYTIAYDQLGRWMNIDVPIETQEDATLRINVWHEGESYSTAAVYLVSKSVNSMIEVKPIVSSPSYLIDNLPDEMVFTAIAVQEEEGSWLLAKREFTAGDNLELDLQMEEINYNDLKRAIDELD